MIERRTFICSSTQKLSDLLERIGEDHLRALEIPLVVFTKAMDYDRDLDGRGIGIRRAAKRLFIESHIGEDEVFENRQELEKTLGPGSVLEVFDRWFEVTEVDHFEIGPEDWQ